MACCCRAARGAVSPRCRSSRKTSANPSSRIRSHRCGGSSQTASHHPYVAGACCSKTRRQPLVRPEPFDRGPFVLSPSTAAVRPERRSATLSKDERPGSGQLCDTTQSKDERPARDRVATRQL